MASDTAEFMAYALVELDTRDSIQGLIELTNSKVLSADAHKQELFSGIMSLTCNDYTLLESVVYPIEETLNYRLPQKEFTKVFMRYYAMPLLKKNKIVLRQPRLL